MRCDAILRPLVYICLCKGLLAFGDEKLAEEVVGGQGKALRWGPWPGFTRAREEKRGGFHHLCSVFLFPCLLSSYPSCFFVNSFQIETFISVDISHVTPFEKSKYLLVTHFEFNFQISDPQRFNILYKLSIPCPYFPLDFQARHRGSICSSYFWHPLSPALIHPRPFPSSHCSIPPPHLPPSYLHPYLIPQQANIAQNDTPRLMSGTPIASAIGTLISLFPLSWRFLLSSPSTLYR